MFTHLDRRLFSLVPPPPNTGSWVPASSLAAAGLRCLEAALGLNLTPGPACPPPSVLCHQGKELLPALGSLSLPLQRPPYPTPVSLLHSPPLRVFLKVPSHTFQTQEAPTGSPR